MLRRSIFILSFLIIALSTPVGFMVTGASAQDQPPPEEYIPEGDPTPPPPLTVRNPELVVVPSGEAQVYMVPNMTGVYFYGGSWYRYHHGVWFMASVYNEPWVFVQPPMVPSFVIGVPPAYVFYLPRGYHRIHYGEFHSHWRTWDREKHWHNQQWFKNERRAEVRQARERQAHARMEKERHQRQERVKADKVGYKQRLADHAKSNKSTHSDKTGKIDKDKTATTGNTTKMVGTGTTKTGGAITNTKTGGTGTTKIDKTGTTGGTTKTSGINKTGGTTTKTGVATKIRNQPKPQPKPKPQVQPRPQPQSKPQIQPRSQPQLQPRAKDDKRNVR